MIFHLSHSHSINLHFNLFTHILAVLTREYSVSPVLTCFSVYCVQRFNPSTPTVAIWIHVKQSKVKHHVSDRVKPSFVIFDIRALWRSDAQDWASECPDVKNYKWRLHPVWHGMLHMATVSVKGLIGNPNRQLIWEEEPRYLCKAWSPSRRRSEATQALTSQ